MTTAKIIQHGAERAVVLPPDFLTDGDEVQVEQRGAEFVISALPSGKRPKFETLADIARHLAEKFPEGGDFPDVERLQEQDHRDITW